MVKRIINKLKDIHKIEPGLITFRLILMLLEVAVLYINIIIPKFIMAELYDNNIFLAIIIIVIVLFINIVNAIIDRILSIKIKKKTENLNICLIDYFLRTTSKISITEYYNQNFFDDFTIAFEKTSEIYNNVLNISINYLKSIISITLISTTIFIYDTWVLTILTVFALINIYLYRFRNRYEYKFNYENIKNKRKLEYIYKLFTRTNYLRDLKLGDYKKYIFTKKNIFSIEFLNK